VGSPDMLSCRHSTFCMPIERIDRSDVCAFLPLASQVCVELTHQPAKPCTGPTSRTPGESHCVPPEMLDKYVGKVMSKARRTHTRVQSPNGRMKTPPKLNLDVVKMGGMLPLSPPASPPFSPTDNNREGTGDDLIYPAGNWTFGERAGADADPVDW